MDSELWTFLTFALKEYGLMSVVILGLLGIIAYQFKLLKASEGDKTNLQNKLLELSEKRLADAKEERQDYEELARDLDKHISLLIKVFRKNTEDEEL
jgi:hypothetical protein